VIAEIGHNHQGSLDKARELFREAKLAGAHAVKLQKRHNRGLYTRAAYEKPYDNENSFGATYGEHREFLEFGKEEYVALQAYAKELGVDFFATAFDMASADFLESLNVPAYKIASGDLKSLPLLKHVASFGKPMIVSTGGALLEDVQRAYDAILPINPKLAIFSAPRDIRRRSKSSTCESSAPTASTSGSGRSVSRATTTALPCPSPPTCSVRASSKSTSR
jgi:N-acetylneuraminate synthase/sialic acid synthase